MKIMSLNVNQFQVVQLSQGCWAKDIVALVKGFLLGCPEGAVFLYEIPYKKGNQSLYDDFRKNFPESSYKIIPEKTKTAYIRTLAIVRKGSGWKPELCIFEGLEEEDDYKNRYNMLKLKKETKDDPIYILGIHAPMDYRFLKGMRSCAEQEDKYKRLIILGDFNITTNRIRFEKQLKELKVAKEKLKRTKKAGNTISNCADLFARLSWLLGFMDEFGFTIATLGKPIKNFKAKEEMPQETLKIEEIEKQMEALEDAKTAKDISKLEFFELFFEDISRKLKAMFDAEYISAIENEPITFFTAGSTIDHVLFSHDLEGKVTANAISQEELELSDHAVIIVDIKE